MLVIKSENFATGSHLLCSSEGYSWSEMVSENAVFADSGNQSLEELAGIFGYDLEQFIPANYIKSAEHLSVSPPWCFYMGKNRFMKRVEDYCVEYRKFIEMFDTDLIDIHSRISWFLKQLKPVKYSPSSVDSQFRNHFEKSIAPYLVGNTLPIPVYSRTKTKTGRLSVVKGPSVLTMHAGLRPGIIDGHQVDFISMEPNFLLAIQGRKPLTNLYDSIRQEAFSNEISRTKVKIATISALYGDNRSDKFSRKISDYFNLDSFVETLEGRIEGDTIRNEYGRLVKLQGARGRHLLSLWLQSSATDGALYGFYNFYKKFEVSPLWIIHDALIFIANGDALGIKELDVGLGIKLPVKVDKL